MSSDDQRAAQEVEAELAQLSRRALALAMELERFGELHAHRYDNDRRYQLANVVGRMNRAASSVAGMMGWVDYDR